MKSGRKRQQRGPGDARRSFAQCVYMCVRVYACACVVCCVRGCSAMLLLSRILIHRYNVSFFVVFFSPFFSFIFSPPSYSPGTTSSHVPQTPITQAVQASGWLETALEGRLDGEPGPRLVKILEGCTAANPTQVRGDPVLTNY